MNEPSTIRRREKTVIITDTVASLKMAVVMPATRQMTEKIILNAKRALLSFLAIVINLRII